jgi:hypothetical protein
MLEQLIQKLRDRAASVKSKAKTLKGMLAAVRADDPVPRWERRFRSRKFGSWQLKPPLRTFTQEERDVRRAIGDPAFRRTYMHQLRKAINAKVAALTPADWFCDATNNGWETLVLRYNRVRAAHKGIKPCAKPDPDGDAARHGQALRDLAKQQYAALRVFGSSYSGITSHCMLHGRGRSDAGTDTEKGARYSGRFYHRTDATHWVTFGYSDMEQLLEVPERVRTDGIVLIGAEEVRRHSARVRWLVKCGPKGKRIKAVTGWVAWNDDVSYHAFSREEAESGLREKVRRQADLVASVTRRESGVAPLYQATVTIAAVRAMTGWCDTGCRNWVRTHLGHNKTEAPWADVAEAARKDRSSYGARLLQLLGASYVSPVSRSVWTGGVSPT